MKKITALFLILVMALTTLVACTAGGTTTGNDQGTDNSADTSVDTGNGDKLAIKEDKLDGYEYNILVTGNVNYTHGSHHYGNDFYYDENSSDKLSAAKYKWITGTEQKFDITIEVTDKLKWNGANGTGEGYKEINEAYTSSEARYDHCMIGTYDVANLARNGYLQDINDIAWINLNNSWWDQVANKDLSIQGTMYYTTGDISVNDNAFTHCILFNKELIKANDLTSPYDYVNNNTWTLDNFTALAKAGADTTGIGTEANYVYGLMTWNDSWLQLMASGDERIASVDENGELALTMYSERTQALYSAWSEIAKNAAYAINYQTGRGSSEWDTFRNTTFNDGKALLYTTLFSSIVHHRDANVDFGIVPYPKYDASQENYGHLISAFHSSFYCVPVHIEDEDITGSVSEYMAYYGQQTTMPAYYEDTLQGQFFRDDESADMLDIIFASRAYDAGISYKIGDISSKLGTLHSNATLTFSQIYNERGAMAEAIIETINTQFAEAKGAE